MRKRRGGSQKSPLMATPLGCGKAASVVPSVFECRLSQADVVAVPLVNKYKGDVAPAAAMNYNASAATTRDADRIGGRQGRSDGHGQGRSRKFVATSRRTIPRRNADRRHAASERRRIDGRSSPDAAAPVTGGRSTPGNSGASGGW